MGKHYFKCLACGREEEENVGVKYFKIPDNSERKAKWLNCINKQHLIHEKLSRDSRICERHFSKDMYAKSMMRLKRSATPNLEILKNISNITEGNIDHSVTSNKTQGFEHVPLNENVQMKESLSFVAEEAKTGDIQNNKSINTPVKAEDEPLSEGFAAKGVTDVIVETSPKGHKSTHTSSAESEQTAAQETVTKAIACKQEFDANSLGCSTSTWSSECSFSIKTESESYPPAQQNPNEAVTVKNEYSQDAWSCYQGSESSFLTQDNTDFEPTTNLEGYPRANDAILPGNFHRAQTADFVPDEHSTYGAYIADRFYNANRNKSEDNVAQMLIESVMLNLLSGIYGYSINFVEADEVGQKEEAPSLPTQLTNKPTVNAVVVKEEVDL